MNFTIETPEELKDRKFKETIVLNLMKTYEAIKKAQENKSYIPVNFEEFFDIKLSKYVTDSPEFTFRQLLDQKGWDIIKQPNRGLKILPKRQRHLNIIDEHWPGMDEIL